jgi:multidrug transporter EmrE-like cation transporter
LIGYLYVFATLACTVYGQVILKWRMRSLNWDMPATGFMDKCKAYLIFLMDPFVLSGFFVAFIASVFWVLAMTKLELTVAYPFMSLAPAIVFLFGVYLFDEPLTTGKVVGIIFIIIGLILTVKLK